MSDIEAAERSDNKMMNEKDMSDAGSVPVLTSPAASDSNLHKMLGSADYTTVRKMKSRHLSFIAIGGTIGTGIFLSTGSSVATAGPAGALLAYITVGCFVFSVIMLLGEMSSFIPVSGAFSVFGERFVAPWLGATLGWNYSIQWMLSIPSELVAASIVLSFWTSKLQTWQWSLIIVIPIFLMQLIHVRVYGESEFWLSLIKVILILLFIIVGLIYDWGGVIGHPGPGLSNFRDGPFAGGFAGFVSSFTFAFYSYGGTELVALAAGESENPSRSVPRAVKSTFLRILLFYVLTIFVIGLNINHNDERLFSAYDNSDVAASPITIVFQEAGFKGFVHVVNACLLTAVLSATNSCFFASSRMLLSLSREGKAPKFLGWVTKRGVPVPALILVLLVSFLSFFATIWGDGVVFTWFINVNGMSALLTWASIGVISLRFRYAMKKQGRTLDDLPFKAPIATALGILVIVFACLMFAAQNWAATTYDDGKLAQDIIAVDIGLVLFFGIGLIFAVHQKVTQPSKPLLVPIMECDLVTDAVWGPGGGEIDREERRKVREAEGVKKHLLKRVWHSI